VVDATEVLGAMLTPAVLISACGSLVISTSNRLSRVVDRFRQLAHDAEPLEEGAVSPAVSGPPASAPLDARRRQAREQFDLLARRAILLRAALTRLYVAIGLLVATSLGVAVLLVAGVEVAWLPVATALIGGGALFHASWLLIREARLAVDANLNEIDFARSRLTR
jgi:hypothetical protein